MAKTHHNATKIGHNGGREPERIAADFAFGGATTGGAVATRRVVMLLMLLGRLFCFLGFHDFRVEEASMTWGPGDTVSKVRCRRCGYQTTRHL
jgi:hypothetical protein